MDDVWTAEAWTDLQEAFPKAHQTGKILITSRNEEVARQANRNRDPHKLRFLRPHESWLLFQLEVFGKPECPLDLEVHGRLIVHKCGGLPLAIVVIAGILVKKYFTGDIIVVKNTWRMISESVPTYLKENDSMETVISLSYNKLPDYLRPCFLYLGMFPEDFEIPVWTLIRMWIAEGFIELRTGITLEQTAQDYLEELISRNLVMAEKVSTDGRIKTCRIHDTLRQFCKNESAPQKGNFFQEIKYVKGGFDPSIADLTTYRRLCVHSSMVDFISKQPSGPRVRSFLCNSREEKIHLPVENVSSIPEAFRLLRILDAKPVTFTKFPRDLTKLVHLRYVVLSSSFTVIPEAISKLWNLQTLVVYTTHRTIDIKANIWNMSQLRHVKTNASAILPKTGKSDEATEKRLQTLGTISPQSCTEEVFKRVSGLKKLGIRGMLVAVLGTNGLEKVNELEKLKLVDDLNTGSTSGGKLQRLPEPYKFPPHLKRLTLCNTSLDWIHMSTLGMLETLEVLKLKERAFVGPYWMASAGGFRQLEVLHIERTDLVIWKAEANHFPGLKRLVLRNCEQLEEIPFSLSEINSFQRLELKRSRSAVPSANKIAEAKKLQEKKKSDALQHGEIPDALQEGIKTDALQEANKPDAQQEENEPDASYGIKFKLYVAPSDE